MDRAADYYREQARKMLSVPSSVSDTDEYGRPLTKREKRRREREAREAERAAHRTFDLESAVANALQRSYGSMNLAVEGT